MGSRFGLSKDRLIMCAAEEVFSRHGFERATIDEIVAIANVGKGTVYNYFKNKELMFYKLVYDKNSVFINNLYQICLGKKTLYDKLISYFEIFIKFYYNNRAIWQIVFFEMLGTNCACLIQKVCGEYRVFPRYRSIKVSQETEEKILRYHKLLHDEYQILEDIIKEASDRRIVKCKANYEDSTRFLFFGAAMIVFYSDESLNRNFDSKKIAKIVVDRYLNGEARDNL